MTSPFVFKQIGYLILQKSPSVGSLDDNGTGNNSNNRIFLSHFGITPLNIYRLWQLLKEEEKNDEDEVGVGENGMLLIAPRHLMWTLLWLRTYIKEELMTTIVGCTEKTIRKWVQNIVDRLAQNNTLVSFCVGLFFF
jgi:hypothetical protein